MSAAVLDASEVSPSAPPSAAAAPAAPARVLVGAGWFSTLAVLLCGLAPLLLIAGTTSGTSSHAWLLGLALVVLVGLRFAWLVATHPQRLFELVFWLFTYVFLGLAAMVQMRTARYPETIPFLDTGLNVRTMLVIGAGTVAFGAGLAVAGPGRTPSDPAAPPAAPPAALRTRPHRLYALIAFSLLFAAYYTAKIGPSTLFQPRSNRAAAEGTIWAPTTAAIVKAAASFPLIICFTGLLRWRRERKAAGLRGPVALPLVVLVALLTLDNPISTPRYYAGTAVLAIIVSLGALGTARRARVFGLVLTLGLVLGFPYASAFRTSTTEKVSDRGGPTKVLSSADFDAFDQINNAIAFERDRGARDGQQVLGAVLFFVPRSAWSGKAEDTGILLADYRDYATTNLSSPPWAELYVDGGLVLVLVGLGLIGFVVRRLDLRAAKDRLGGGTALMVTMPFYSMILLRGSLLQAMAGLAVLLVSGLLIGGRGRPRATAA